jgi:hypothetical protein
MPGKQEHEKCSGAVARTGGIRQETGKKKGQGGSFEHERALAQLRYFVRANYC